LIERLREREYVKREMRWRAGERVAVYRVSPRFRGAAAAHAAMMRGYSEN
jgi:hypothetical protein